MNHQLIYNLLEQQAGSAARELFQRLISQSLPETVDVVVVLQGDQLDRLPKAAELQRRFQVPVLLIGNDDFTGPGKREEEELDFRLREWLPVFAKAGVPEEMVVIADQAFNTKEQAEGICEVAQKQHWYSFVVVTSPYHILRAFLSVIQVASRQSFSGKIFMRAADLPWDQLPAGKTKTARELLVSELDKIKKYRSDIANYEEGLAFLATYAKLVQ